MSHSGEACRAVVEKVVTVGMGAGGEMDLWWGWKNGSARDRKVRKTVENVMVDAGW